MNIETFTFDINVLVALLWQYNEATHLRTLLNEKQAWYDTFQTDFWNTWAVNVFDLRSANDFGVCVWAIILNLPIVIEPNPDPPGKPIFGFGPFNQNFNNGNFSSRGTTTFLTLEEKRIVLRLRAYQLTTDCCIFTVNPFLQQLFQDLGPAYILDGLNMSITMVFDFDISPRLFEVIEKQDLIPRGAGVKIKYVISNGAIFGFGPFNQNFNNGNFFRGVII